MKIINRAQLRGKPLDKMCRKARTAPNQYAHDNRIFCYGLIDLMYDEPSFFDVFKDDDFLFQNRFGEQITTRGIAQQLTNYANKYGINKKVMHPHSFRHFFAIEFLKRDNDIALLADLMGHSSIKTTAIYLRLSKQQQIERLNKAMNF